MPSTLFQNPDDASISALLRSVRRIAVVGLSPHPHRDSHRVAAYLQRQGYEIVPVYPREERILGERVFRRVQDIDGPVDLVDVFRASEALPEVVDDVLAAGSMAVWFQLDCIHEEAAHRATEAGLTVVMDRCLLVEQMRLLRGRPRS
jgi:predicted CoA-binding protein